MLFFECKGRYFYGGQIGYASRHETRSMNTPTPKHTGLVCPQCKQPIADIERQNDKVIVFFCPACAYRWSTQEGVGPKH
jgi:ribosomal protein L37AE/L43A